MEIEDDMMSQWFRDARKICHCLMKGTIFLLLKEHKIIYIDTVVFSFFSYTKKLNLVIVILYKIRFAR